MCFRYTRMSGFPMSRDFLSPLSPHRKIKTLFIRNFDIFCLCKVSCTLTLFARILGDSLSISPGFRVPPPRYMLLEKDYPPYYRDIIHSNKAQKKSRHKIIWHILKNFHCNLTYSQLENIVF